MILRAERPLPVVPVRYENIGVVCASVISIAAKNDFFPIGTEHGKGIKGLIVRDLLDIGSILVHDIHIKGITPGIFVVAAENNSSIRQKIRCPVGLAQ